MSRFYGSIQGGRGEARREGHAASGIRAHIRGWRAGVRVIGRAGGTDGNGDSFDVFDVYATSGEGGERPDVRIGEVTTNGYDEPLFVQRR
jgi:hypothetical protein